MLLRIISLNTSLIITSDTFSNKKTKTTPKNAIIKPERVSKLFF